jgi:pimeloyl-ACP methyl ester carboxylesterase
LRDGTGPLPVNPRAPHLDTEPALRRRGGCFLGHADDTAPDASVACWVEWEAPADPQDWREPVVLVHGGGGQATDWTWAVDGQPGWAELFVRRGHPTYRLDRPGYGRSVGDPAVLGERGPVPDPAFLARLFQVAETDLHHRGPGRFWPVAASSTGLLVDVERAQTREAACLARLLAQVGPAFVVTHSAGAPAGWLAADRAPHLVCGLVAVEPLGPPHGGARHARALAAGVTAHPLGAGSGEGGLARVPVLVVTADGSGHEAADRATAEFLADAGAGVEHLLLGEHGLHGDGHGVVFDRGSSAAFDLVHRWCSRARA